MTGGFLPNPFQWRTFKLYTTVRSYSHQITYR
jgi:hypothetical protein